MAPPWCDELTRYDEYRIMLSPMALGGGTPLFQGDYGRFDLRLLDAKTYSTGVVMLFYRPEPR